MAMSQPRWPGRSRPQASRSRGRAPQREIAALAGQNPDAYRYDGTGPSRQRRWPGSPIFCCRSRPTTRAIRFCAIHRALLGARADQPAGSAICRPPSMATAPAASSTTLAAWPVTARAPAGRGGSWHGWQWRKISACRSMSSGWRGSMGRAQSARRGPRRHGAAHRQAGTGGSRASMSTTLSAFLSLHGGRGRERSTMFAMTSGTAAGRGGLCGAVVRRDPPPNIPRWRLTLMAQASLPTEAGVEPAGQGRARLSLPLSDPLGGARMPLADGTGGLFANEDSAIIATSHFSICLRPCDASEVVLRHRIS